MPCTQDTSYRYHLSRKFLHPPASMMTSPRGCEPRSLGTCTAVKQQYTLPNSTYRHAQQYVAVQCFQQYAAGWSGACMSVCAVTGVGLKLPPFRPS